MTNMLVNPGREGLESLDRLARTRRGGLSDQREGRGLLPTLTVHS
jgi:hypothetical protein